MRVVIVGAGAAGLTLASNLRKNDKEIEIIVFTKSENMHTLRVLFLWCWEDVLNHLII